MKTTVYALLALTLLAGCSRKAVVQFKQRQAELRSSETLTQIMLVNKAPRIVLRVPNTRKGVTNTQGTGIVNPVVVKSKKSNRASINDVESQYDETALYNAIEKQLFKEGFSVRDRGLFNEVLDKAQNVDYSRVNGLTNTDLILELVRLDRPVGYSTNVCTLVSKDQQRSIVDYRTLGGASIEFKLIHVRSNEVVGTYKIHYTPCTDGCRGVYNKALFRREGKFTDAYWYSKGERQELRRQRRKPYEALDQDQLEQFMADATHQLVQTMR